MNLINIDQWLEKFNRSWTNHDIQSVMTLFADDVEYWETPHKLLGSKQELEQEWQVIKSQEDINLETKVFCSSSDNKHAIIWKLSYVRDGDWRESGGTYLIGLDDNGVCNFFHYVSSPKK